MKEFVKQFGKFSLGPIIGALIGFITVPITSNLISPDQFGMASMFNLANTILTLIVLIGIDQAYMREYNEYNDKKKLLFNCMLIPCINTVVIGVILILFKSFFANILFDDEAIVTPIVLLAISSPLFIIEKFMLLSIRMEEKALKYSIWNILAKLLNLICLIILLLFYKRNFEAVVYSTILSQVIISIAICINCRKSIEISIDNIDKKQMYRVLKFGIPIIPATLIGYGLNSMDTIFLRCMTTYTELGYYTVALKIINVLTLVQTSFTTFWAPMAFRWKSENVENYKFELVSKAITFIMSSILILILIFKEIIPFIIGNQYVEVIYIFPFLLFYPIFYTMSETTTLGISFSRKTGYNIIVSVISLMVNLVLNTLLIPILGAIGAAFATGISYLVFFWTRTIISRKLWYNFSVKHFIVETIILLLVTTSNVLLRNFALVLIINITALVLTIYNYKDLIDYVMKIRKKSKYTVGLICYETQRNQLEYMINNSEIQVIDLNLNEKNKIKKLLLFIKKVLKVDLVYFGHGCHNVNPYLKISKFLNKKIICHWIGTDVLLAKKNKKFYKVKRYIDYHFACSKLIKEELKELKIEAQEIAILPTNMNVNYSELPKEHGIITYLPEGKEEFYGIEYVKHIAKKYSKINIYVVGNNKDSIGLNNVKFLGKISQDDMSKLYDNTTILLRLPKHDGLSLMLLEALIKGKEVIYCYDFPYTRHVTNKKQLDIEIEDILSKKPKFNKLGHEYVIEYYKIEKIKENLNEILINILRNGRKKMKEENVKYLIIGAGITGLSFAQQVKEKYLIIEKENDIGGYCRTIKKGNYIWDYAGHFFHFKNKNIRNKFVENIGKKNLVKQQKDTKILYKKKKIHYPFQTNIHELDKKEFIDCLYDLYNKREKEEYENFLDMLYGKFGKSIVDKFLKPYNEKLYACNLQNLDQNAMGRFFPYANIKEIIDNMKKNQDESYNNQFLYPKDGAQSFINTIYKELEEKRILLNTKIEKINENEKYAITNDGKKIKYEYLINTIPFNNFLLLFENNKYKELEKILSYNQVLVFNLGFKKKSNYKEHWIYIPSKEINFYRIGFYDNILQSDKLSMYIEIGFDKNEHINISEQLKITLENLEKLGITEGNELEEYEAIIMNPAYVHINNEHNKKIKGIMKEMNKSKIYSIGRYGGWKYCSMEDCILDAMELAEKINK